MRGAPGHCRQKAVKVVSLPLPQHYYTMAPPKP
jgi:hypothetical protein